LTPSILRAGRTIATKEGKGQAGTSMDKATKKKKSLTMVMSTNGGFCDFSGKTSRISALKLVVNGPARPAEEEKKKKEEKKEEKRRFIEDSHRGSHRSKKKRRKKEEKRGKPKRGNKKKGLRRDQEGIKVGKRGERQAGGRYHQESTQRSSSP